jgi:hypothetical protein
MDEQVSSAGVVPPDGVDANPGKFAMVSLPKNEPAKAECEKLAPVLQ